MIQNRNKLQGGNNDNRELAREKEHLGFVREKILDSMTMLQQHKMNIADNLVDYRRQIIEENKFDEDRPLDAFDHEMFAREESYKAALKRINELEDLYENPYFGKVNFRFTDEKTSEKENDNEEIYIGKTGFIDEEDYEPLVVDWRAPVAALFYNGALGKASFVSPQGKENAEILNRRQFIINNSELVGMFDTDTEVVDEILQYVLSGPASAKLKDIIMTIQKEQDRIIRLPLEGAVFVNGISGSGKTTIALHRIAYLLYNNRKKIENKVMILGPNNVFMEYISRVLPSLGEDGVRQDTLFDFVTSLIDEKLEYLPREDFINAVLSGDVELYKDAEYKRSEKYLDSLDKYIRKLTHEFFEFKDIKFLGKTLMTKEEMEKDITDETSFIPLLRRAFRVKRTLINRMKQVRNEKLAEINRQSKEFRKIMNDIEDGRVLREDEYLTRREAIRELIRKVMEFRDEIRYLGLGDPLDMYRSQNTMRILTHEDLIPILYLKYRLKGIRLKKPVRYIVVDEAQDYSPAYFRVLKEITGCRDWTIVGDLNQRFIRYESESFLDTEKIFEKSSVHSLKRSYRSTAQITDFASESVSEDGGFESLRDGESVNETDIDSEDRLTELVVREYERFKENGIESVGIIARSTDFTEILSEKLKGRIPFKLIKSEDDLYNNETVLISAYLSKGLEFDGVIVIDDLKERKFPDDVRYIMCTRALHMLSVINFRGKLQ